VPREEEEQIEELKEEVEKLKKECAVVEFENMCVNNSWKKRETQWMDDFEELKEQLQQEKDGRCCDLDELEKEIEELKRGVTLWKKRAMGINIVSRLVEKEETIEKLEKELEEKEKEVSLINSEEMENEERIEELKKEYDIAEMVAKTLNEEKKALKKELELERGTRKAVVEALGGQEADCFQPYPDDIKLRDITGAIETLQSRATMLKATCLRWQEKADFNLTDSEEEEDMEEHIDTIDAETGEKIVYSDFLTTSEEEEEEKCEECGKCLEGEDKCGEGCPAYDKGWLETHSEEEEDMEKEEKLLNAQIEGEQE